MEKGANQYYVDIWSIPFHNDDPINVQLHKGGKFRLNYSPDTHEIMLYTQFQNKTFHYHLTC